MPSNSGQSVHIPVLIRETLRFLAPQPGQVLVDGTVGGGGHSREILARIGESGRLIGLDRDPMMLRFAANKVGGEDVGAENVGAENVGENVTLVHSSYALLRDVLDDLGIDRVDGVLLDLGLSSDQLADRTRGFSFSVNGPLDLRFDTTQGEPAWALLARLGTDELSAIFRDYGEERFSRRIADRIVSRRSHDAIKTACDLNEAVLRAIPKNRQQRSDRQPAARVFQALRIAVNEELGQLESFLKTDLPKILKNGGRAAIISFHSLEDRLVKNAFRDKSRFRVLTSKPVVPTAAEQRANPRSRSAKLRAVERI